MHIPPLSSSDPRLTGWQIGELNANLDPNGEGQYWGKWSITLDDGSVWEGHYTGTVSAGGAFGISNAELHGTGGSADGMLLKMDSFMLNYFGGLAFDGLHIGYIFDPHAKK